jgi:phosphinothricin acetyltransferase
MEIHIRLARSGDLPRVNAIYNHYVRHSTCTFQETPDTLESRERWFAEHGDSHPVTVAESDGIVAGWAALSRFHARSAYRFSTENSVYVDHEWHRRGIGSRLLEDLITRASALGHHTIIAGIDADQPASVRLHARCGFEPVARLRQVGFKFNRWLDVIYMQRMLG